MRIACLDDDPLIAEITAILLEELGHEVISCANSLEALEVFRAPQPPVDILVIDIHLGGGDDGRAIAAAAKQLTRRCASSSSLAIAASPN